MHTLSVLRSREYINSGRGREANGDRPNGPSVLTWRGGKLPARRRWTKVALNFRLPNKTNLPCVLPAPGPRKLPKLNECPGYSRGFEPAPKKPSGGAFFRQWMPVRNINNRNRTDCSLSYAGLGDVRVRR